MWVVCNTDQAGKFRFDIGSMSKDALNGVSPDDYEFFTPAEANIALLLDSRIGRANILDGVDDGKHKATGVQRGLCLERGNLLKECMRDLGRHSKGNQCSEPLHSLDKSFVCRHRLRDVGAIETPENYSMI
jgi:hypothetical protein